MVPHFIRYGEVTVKMSSEISLTEYRVFPAVHALNPGARPRGSEGLLASIHGIRTIPIRNPPEHTQSSASRPAIRALHRCKNAPKSTDLNVIFK